MQALVLEPGHALALREVPFTRHESECAVRVLRAGICGTDVRMLDGYADFTGVLGHEFVGIVESVSQPADAHWIGRRVVGEINVGCGQCDACRDGFKEHCPARTVLGIRGRDGAFAPYVSLPRSNLHAVPEAVSDDAAVFVEPTAAACRILEQVAITGETRAAVVGDGRMALIVSQVLKTVTSKVTLFGRHAHKRRVARALGLEVAADAVLPRAAFDLVVDVTGRPEGLPLAIALARPRGTVVIKTTDSGVAPVAVWPVVVNELTLIGSRCGPFAPAMALLASGTINVQALVSAVLPLSEYARAFDLARHELKVVFEVQP